MNVYKDYLQKVQKRSLNEAFIILCGDISHKLNHYIEMIDNLKIKHESYQEYYGEVKRIVNSFVIHWTEVMNTAIKEADKVTKVVKRDDLLDSVDKTIAIQKSRQIDFEHTFLPINSPEEKAAYDEILVLYDKQLAELDNIRDTVASMRDLQAIERFAKDHYYRSLRKKNERFVFTHTYIAVMLTQKVKDIRISLEEISHRVHNNLNQMQEKWNEEVSDLLNKLYKKNKEQIVISRKSWRSSSEIADVQRCLERLKNRIEAHQQGVLSRLKEEAEYWNEKLKEFNLIDKSIADLKEAEQKVLEQQQQFFELRDTPAPESKGWDHVEKVLNTKLEHLNELKKEAGRALLSFFSIRGPDQIYYNDRIGRYYVDEYGHKVYCYDYGLNMFHVDCEGNFFEAHDTEAYFYDTNGRYVIDEKGEKVYKMGSCTSSYRLVDDLLKKCTLDCGHSERQNKNCKMDIRDCYNELELPKVQMMDIKETLSKETALYLWDSFGHVLPEVLFQVANEQPKNPIHSLAHKLIRYKYNRTPKDMEKKKEDAAQYRAAIYQDRKDKTAAASNAWKAKQVQRRKPEESDDTDAQAVYGAYLAQQEFIGTLINFYE